MCGLFGWQLEATVTTAERVAMATHLAVEMNERGEESWGAWTPCQRFVYKQTGSVIDGAHAMRLTQFDAMAVHTRYATHGAVVKSNAHPFRSGRIVGAHNGCIWNSDLMDVRYPARDCPVDSMHLIAHIAEDRKLKELTGYGAVVWSDTSDPSAFYMGRFCGGELAVAIVFAEVGSEVRGIVWASTARALKQALTAAGMRFALIKIRERRVYRVAGGKVRKTGRHLSVRERAVMSPSASVTQYPAVKGNAGFVTSTGAPRDANDAALAWLREDRASDPYAPAGDIMHAGTSPYTGRGWASWGNKRDGARVDSKALLDGFKHLADDMVCEQCGAQIFDPDELEMELCVACITDADADAGTWKVQP